MTTRRFALALAASLLLPALPARAEPLPPPRIVVTGEGEMAVRPDLAIVSLAVMREAKSAREALDANNAAMARVIAAMKETGIAERDLQTAGLQIMPRYTYTNKPDGTQQAELVGYEVTNTLSVRIRDLAKTGEILDQAVTLGINLGGGGRRAWPYHRDHRHQCRAPADTAGGQGDGARSSRLGAGRGG